MTKGPPQVKDVLHYNKCLKTVDCLFSSVRPSPTQPPSNTCRRFPFTPSHLPHESLQLATMKTKTLQAGTAGVPPPAFSPSALGWIQPVGPTKFSALPQHPSDAWMPESLRTRVTSGPRTPEPALTILSSDCVSSAGAASQGYPTAGHLPGGGMG